jgi:ribosomal protein S12 methylthiotransferase
MAKKVYLEQLGCPKNEVDGEHLMGALARAGYERTADPALGDVLVVNTCGFIEPAKKESIDRILHLAQLKNGNGCRLLVAGCLAQRYPQQLLSDIPEIDALIGVDRPEDVVAAALGKAEGNCYVSRPHKKYTEYADLRPEVPRAWAYLKISDGCDNACSFCAIPQFRGKNRSRAFGEIIREAEVLVGSGALELVVVAQDTTSYGVDRYGRSRLAELLLRLAEVRGIRWVRLMYAFPFFVDDELIEVITQGDRVTRYLDMPIQHIDNELLQQMNRRLDGTGTRKLLDRIRTRNPDVALRTSVIVGHPGETAAAFARLSDLVADFEFDRLGVFLYSEEEGTRAMRMGPATDGATAEYRRRMLLDIQSDVLAHRQDSRVGTCLDVLVETSGPDGVWGRTEYDAPEVDCAARLKNHIEPGTMIAAKCTGTAGVDLVVEPV